MVSHTILDTVPCAIQQGLVVYPFYTYQSASANSKFPIQPSATSHQPGNHQSIFYVPDFVSGSQIGSFVLELLFKHTHTQDQLPKG